MKFLALISGGKDSIFNIMKCQEQGHELVLLVNLHFEDQGIEKDSYMYQTVGANLIDVIAEAIGVPIIRKLVTGKAIIRDLKYKGLPETKQGDEVEDLFDVLKLAIQKYPDIQGVSSGAIASTYQKLRVEDCCKRLGLQSLAFLWGQNQTFLLYQMIQNQMDVIIIKVASLGLTNKHLGKNLRDVLDHFIVIVIYIYQFFFFFIKKEKYGFHPCGEGGEFESLTLDCPIYKKKIQIIDYEIKVHSQGDIAQVSYIFIKEFKLLDK